MGSKKSGGAGSVVWHTPSVSGTWLKNFGTIAMLLQTLAVAVIENGVIHLSSYTQAELSEAMAADSNLMMQAGIASVLELVGGLAIPVFAFLLVEGFLNTSSYRKYLLTMAAFALISEIPYDFAWMGRCVDWSSQNSLITLTICLVMLYCLQFIKEHREGFFMYLFQILIVICGVFWVTLFRAQYGLCTVLLVGIFYVFYGKNGIKTLLGVLVSLMYVTGPLAFYGIWCYNGERKDLWPKYVYYIFYPAHLLVLGMIARLL